MPIGAAIGSAAVGIGGAVLSGRSQRRAADQASDTARDTAAQNNALSREIYGYNAARLDPFVQGGLRAGNALQGLLLGPQATTAPTGGALGGGFPGPGGGATMTTLTPEQEWANGAVAAMMPRITNRNRRAHLESISDPIERFNQALAYSPPTSDQYPLYQAYLQANPRPAPGAAAPTTTPATPTTPATGTPTTPATGTPATNPALSAWDQFRNSTNYQWRFNEGQKALEMSRLPGGGYDSGATRKAVTEYGQMFAANELGAYMDRLAQQQQIGLGGASALAGVGMNMVGQVSANNNMAGSAAANAALAQGSANAQMWGGIANSVGTAIGALGRPSSYGG